MRRITLRVATVVVPMALASLMALAGCSDDRHDDRHDRDRVTERRDRPDNDRQSERHDGDRDPQQQDRR